MCLYFLAILTTLAVSQPLLKNFRFSPHGWGFWSGVAPLFDGSYVKSKALCQLKSTLTGSSVRRRQKLTTATTEQIIGGVSMFLSLHKVRQWIPLPSDAKAHEKDCILKPPGDLSASSGNKSPEESCGGAIQIFNAWLYDREHDTEDPRDEVDPGSMAAPEKNPLFGWIM